MIAGSTLPNQARYQLRYTRLFSFFHHTTVSVKIKDFSVCGNSCGQCCSSGTVPQRENPRQLPCCKKFRATAVTNGDSQRCAPKPPALPTAPHPEIDMKFYFEVANMWYESLLQGFCESRKIELSLEYQGFQRLLKNRMDCAL